ncbi:POT family proton-dependent oligopeptide transporter [Balneicella halophila]|uniref:POT family proton-dependent oligopeptide transporter n=1 Tax=Balneicella halophila TaxID=1537566 RepID=A0A7L4USF5_BALHA|nr:peptide MFS transporter [Balneicella halophila]PVX52432.1 POT family proton-dependent oligopeptide transporter [Balneicella halophila]
MNQTTVKEGHPKGLYVLFMAEMWERFCYYGMRVLLTLYLVKQLLYADSDAYLIYGSYTALVYLAPVFGGRIADAWLGYRKAIIFGALAMALGEFMILGGTADWLFWGMGFLIIGNGYFKANISSIVGKLYRDGDPRRDSGFTIFYIGINVGALLATLIVSYVGETYGFKYGFGLAGIGMLLGFLIFVAGSKHFREQSNPPSVEKLKKKVGGIIPLEYLIYILSIAMVPVIYYLVNQNTIVQYLLAVSGVGMIAYLIYEGVKGGKVLLDRMILFVILCLFNVVFWALFEQAGTSLTLFADTNVDRNIFGIFEMTAGNTQFFNPFYIIVFGSLFSVMWLKLDKIGMNPNIPMKFGLGIIQLGLGYLVVQLGAQFAPDYKVPIWTLGLLYMLHTTGELFISPIGLSMVTKLAPAKLTGTVMGVWFLSTAAANFLAGKIATLTGGHHVEGVESVAASPAESLATYTDVYTQLGMWAVGIGLFAVVLSPLLKKLLHGVK